MKAITILSFAVVVSVSTTQQSCSNGDAAKVAAIDSLISLTDSLSNVVNAIELPVYQHMDSVFRSQKNWIEEQFSDTLDRERAMILGNYHRAMNKSLGRVLRNRNEMHQELDYSRKQLGALRHDVDRGLLHDNPKETYFGQERLVLQQLTASVDVLRSSAATAQREWDRYHLKVDSIRAAIDTTANLP